MVPLRSLRRAVTALLSLALFAATLLPPAGAAAKQLRFIRDAEIENTIQIYATPLFQAAGLNPRAMQVYLINDDSLNAFVTGGTRMYIHTGLLMRAEDPLEVIGVIAHETGHMQGGHIAAKIEEGRLAGKALIASYVLGLAAVLATGRGELGAAALLGGQDIVVKNLLAYSRSHEQAADQAAVRLLQATEQSPRGLLDFMRVLSGQEVLLSSNQDPYLRTHPLSIERVTFLEEQVARSPYADKPASPELQALHRRMRAKLIGFLRPISQVHREYPRDDPRLEARYAQAIGYYRDANLERALPLVEGLLAKRPDDPYFHELKGQMLFENGHLKESMPSLETAVRLLPDAPQIRLLLARAYLESNDPDLNAKAVEQLEAVLRDEADNSFAWRLAATAYGRAGDEGMTALALAEAALAQGAFAEAKAHAGRALKLLASGTPNWLQAEDVQNQAIHLAGKKN
jgi:predicted Zn-dependent protease